LPIPGTTIGLDWLAENALRKHPLADDATALDTTGEFSLPSELLVDAVFPINIAQGWNPDGFLVRELLLFGRGLVLVIAYTENDSTYTEVGRISVGVAHVENASYYMSGVGIFSGLTARVTVGRVDSALRAGGAFVFDRAGARLSGVVVRPDVSSVTSIRVRNGSDLSEPLYGDIELVAGSNVSLQITPSGDIRINAVSGLNLNTDCACAATTDRALTSPVRTLNGVSPNAAGNIFLVGTTCLTLSNLAAGIKFDNSCAKPCCTSSDLARLSTDIGQLRVDVREQTITIAQLEAKLSALQSLANAIEATGFII